MSNVFVNMQIVVQIMTKSAYITIPKRMFVLLCGTSRQAGHMRHVHVHRLSLLWLSLYLPVVRFEYRNIWIRNVPIPIPSLALQRACGTVRMWFRYVDKQPRKLIRFPQSYSLCPAYSARYNIPHPTIQYTTSEPILSSTCLVFGVRCSLCVCVCVCGRVVYKCLPLNM